MSDNTMDMDNARLIAESINRIFADAVDRKLLEDFDKGNAQEALWKTVCDSGFQRVLESDGKPAASWNEAQPVLRALGYYRAPLPLAESLVANWLLARASLPPGDAAMSIVDGGELQMKVEGGALTISGTAKRVPWARHAQRLVIGGRSDGQTLIGVVDTAAAKVTAGRNIASEPRDEVSFEQVRCSAFGTIPTMADGGDVNPVRLYGALARAAAIAGAADSVLDQSVQYAKDRVQFGRPIGKFQAVQHLLADLACEAAAASAAATTACRSAGTTSALLDVAAAKVRAGDAANRAARIGHAVHAAIGFTHEHTLHFGTRRLWSWRGEFGNEAYWARQLGTAAIRGKRKNFWTDLTRPLGA